MSTTAPTATARRDPTPTDLSITPRNVRFARGRAQDRWWLGGDPIGSAYHNALSITFPRGEAYFVESVKAFRDGTPEKLAPRDPRLHAAGGHALARAPGVQHARVRRRLSRSTTWSRR